MVGIHSTVLLICVAQGDPAISISWDFERSIITNETSLRVSSYASVSIKPLVVSIAVQYSCTLNLKRTVC